MRRRSYTRHPRARRARCPAGRLKGTLLGVKSVPCMPLSVEGQAHRLIEEASSKENLGMMYIWWGRAGPGEGGAHTVPTARTACVPVQGGCFHLRAGCLRPSATSHPCGPSPWAGGCPGCRTGEAQQGCPQGRQGADKEVLSTGAKHHSAECLEQLARMHAGNMLHKLTQ